MTSSTTATEAYVDRLFACWVSLFHNDSPEELHEDALSDLLERGLIGLEEIQRFGQLCHLHCAGCDTEFQVPDPLVDVANCVPCDCGATPSFEAGGTLVVAEDPGEDTWVGSARSIDGYRLRSTLGKGSSSRVLLAEGEDKDLYRLKVMTSVPATPEVLEQLASRVGALETISCPSVGRVHSHGVEPGGFPYVLSEHLRGASLNVVVAERKPPRLALGESVYVLLAIARGLAAYHAQGLVHGALKPSNVLLGFGGEVLLVDGGFEHSGDPAFSLKLDPRTLEALRFAPPEPLRGEAWLPPGDVYSLGAMAWSLIAGRLPFRGKRLAELVAARLARVPPPLSTERSDVPVRLENLVASMLNLDPGLRPSAQDVADALGASELLWSSEEIVRRWRPELEAAAGLPGTTHRDLTLQPGAQLGPYRIRGVLARGGMGVVYRAYHQTLRKTVALKTLLDSSLADEASRRRFIREAEAVAALDHPTIVPILDCGDQDGTLFLTLELIEGSTLFEWAAGRPVPEILGVLRQVCAGIQHAHSRGVIHRDLKPDNLLVDLEDKPRILDFGVAKTEGASQALTDDGAILGTLAYMPPEQASGNSQSVDVRGDVYSLGVVLYELICGRRPFQGSLSSLLRQILHDDPAPPSRHAPHVPWELDAICLKALEKDAANRYQSVLEFSNDLGRHLEGLSILARKASLSRRLRKWAKRHRRRVAVGLVALALGTTAITVIVAQEQLEARRHKGRVIEEIRVGWRSYAAQEYLRAASAFEAAHALADGQEEFRLSEVGLDRVPLEATPDLEDTERSTLRISRPRLRTWRDLAQRRAELFVVDQHLSHANQALAAGDLERAIDEASAARRLNLQRAQKTSERAASALIQKARKELAEGSEGSDLAQRRVKLERARQQINYARRAAPERGFADLETVLRELGKLTQLEHEAAIQAARKARSADAEGAGQAALKSKRLQDARRLFEQALGADGTNTAALRGLAKVERLLVKQERLKEEARRVAVAEGLRKEARQALTVARNHFASGELPERVRADYINALEALRRAELARQGQSATQDLLREVAREFAAVLVDQGQAPLARYVRRIGGLPERDNTPVTLPRDPTLSVVEAIHASARSAFGTPVVFLPTRVFDSLRRYVASQTSDLRFELRVLGRVERKGTHPEVYFTGIEVRMHDRRRNTVSAPKRVLSEQRFLRLVSVDTQGRRLIRPFNKALRISPQAIVRQVERIVQAQVRDAKH